MLQVFKYVAIGLVVMFFVFFAVQYKKAVKEEREKQKKATTKENAERTEE